MPSEPWRTLTLIAACLCLACAEDEAAEAKPADLARATLAEAPEVIRTEIQRGCDKWKAAAGGCDEAAVERDQLSCWVEAGLPNLRRSIEANQGPYFQNHRVLLHQQSCMERRGWRLQTPGDLMPVAPRE